MSREGARQLADDVHERLAAVQAVDVGGYNPRTARGSPERAA